jgi:membrane-bound ClpP family serine protease
VLDDTQLIERLLDDPVLFATTLWAVSKPQAVERGINEEQFAELLVGDVTANAVTALIEGIIGFFQPPRRDLLRQLWTKLVVTREAAVELAKTKVTSPAMDQAIQRAMAAMSDEIDRKLNELGKSSTSSPESPA